MTSCAQPRLRSFHGTAWTLIGALLFVLFVPWLFRRGMFWDGVVYGTIARNLAAGVGDAWHPIVTSTFLRHIREHPPLGFWLQAAYFRTLGDHFWVERLYGLTTLLITGSLLLAIWRWLLRDRPRASACCWVAVGLWAPFGMWCYRHNMLENTMGVFTALSVYATLRAFDGRRGGAAFWSILSGLAIAAAVLSKGPVGLFPAVTPAIAWITLRRTLPLPLGEGRGEGEEPQTPHPNPLPKGEGTAQNCFARALSVQMAVLCTLGVSFGL
ncbi:MAG: glycosyltransferase family 39 protein, partial [Planctomycetia bacterium]|nr:glycosyltransferase family 39 protein [Planctomycetia bacterium]